MIGIGNDHNGYEVKQELTKYIKKLGYDVIDYGCNDTIGDYPTYAFKVSEAVSKKEIDLGILICKTGTGMSIAANKVKHVRCAKVENKEEAFLARSHNNANVLAISALLPIKLIKEIVKTFIETPFSNEERHIRRIEMIENYDN